MKKELRIIINVLILLVVAGFVWYMISSFSKEKPSYNSVETEQQNEVVFVSPYAKEYSFEVQENICALELVDDKIYVAAMNSVIDRKSTRLNSSH